MLPKSSIKVELKGGGQGQWVSDSGAQRREIRDFGNGGLGHKRL